MKDYSNLNQHVMETALDHARIKHPEFDLQNWQGHREDRYSIYSMIGDDCLGYSGQPGAKVMDIGANIGMFSALCASNGSYVVAYEPFDAVFEELLVTAKVLPNIHPIRAAVYTYTGTVSFAGSGGLCTDTPWCSYNGSIQPDRGEVICVSLADAIGDAEWDCVKMDVEGAEWDILLQASDETLQRIKFFTVEFHNGAVDQATHDQVISRLSKVFSFLKQDMGADGNPNRTAQIHAMRK